MMFSRRALTDFLTIERSVPANVADAFRFVSAITQRPHSINARTPRLPGGAPFRLMSFLQRATYENEILFLALSYQLEPLRRPPAEQADGAALGRRSTVA
jgi:hypothetical protein